MRSRIHFSDLANSKVFQDFCGIVSALTGIRICLVNACNPAECKYPLAPTRDNPLCALIQAAPGGKAACDACDASHLELARRRDEGFSYRCHAGLIDLVVPVFIEGVHLATINGGQVLPEPPSEEGFRQILNATARLQIDPGRLRPLYFGCPCVTSEQLRETMKLLAFFSNYFCEVGGRLKAGGPVERIEITRARQYIERHFREPLRLSQVARHAFLSTAYFSHLFMKSTRIGFAEYVQRLRVEETTKLLRTSRQTVTEIACSVGFNNISHFNRVFRKLVGCSPTEYRSRHSRGTHKLGAPRGRAGKGSEAGTVPASKDKQSISKGT
ncbi:MAG: PocR ligand-binding domain-containing protein [Acidobacteriota bacterium]